MTELTLDFPRSTAVSEGKGAVRLLQVFSITLMVFPSDFVIKAVGADGYVAALVSYVLFLVWLAATLFGLHNPFNYYYPVRMALFWLWIVSLTSYLLMNRAELTAEEVASAQRWLMQLAGMSGVLLVAAEGLKSISDIRRVLRALTWGGAFCGLVAALQFKAAFDLTPYIKKLLPGFISNGQAYSVFEDRSGLSRVVGTAIHPIELGVSAGMLLPLAVYMAKYDTDQPKWRRWIPVIGICLSIPASVSRSAIIAVAIAIGVYVVSLPAPRRVLGFAAILVGVVATFMTSHGLIGTLTNYFMSGSKGASVAHRLDNYPMVEHLVRRAPLIGQGGGTYIATSAVTILDNEYLTIAIELGLFGVAALVFFVFWPGFVAFYARARSVNSEVRDLCAALAGATFAGAVCCGTFDSFSFPMYFNVQTLVVGLIGTVWLLVAKERNASRPIAWTTTL